MATYISMVDLAGMIPQFIANSAAKGQAYMVQNLTKVYVKYFGESSAKDD